VNLPPIDRREDSTPATNRALFAALPNWLCYFRLAGSIVLVGLAAAAYWTLVCCLLVVLLMSDWIDGQLARRFHGVSRYGALLDTVADAAMYGAILIATVWFAPATLGAYLPWIAAGVASYLLHVVAGIIKFRRWPSYHTRIAKTGWLFVLLGLIGIVIGQPEWTVRLAAIVVIAANLEGILITLMLPAYRDNVRSILHVLN
jgi:cardiolipin synthase (CMP-forming)